jgi:hypothetical protein
MMTMILHGKLESPYQCGSSNTLTGCLLDVCYWTSLAVLVVVANVLFSELGYVFGRHPVEKKASHVMLIHIV